MSDFYERDRSTLRVHPHAGQRAILESPARFTFGIAGTQGGKTVLAPVWLHNEIQRNGPGDYLAVTATYDLFRLKFLPEMRRYFETFLGWGEWRASDKIIVSKDGKTRIILRSAQSEGGLESATAKAAVLDECGQDDFRITAWEAILRRLSLNQGRVLGMTTPYNLGWLRTEVYDRWRAGDPNYRVVQFESILNPVFPVEEYERARATLPAWKFRMFYQGQFDRPASLIYGDFSTVENVCSPFDIPANWPRYAGIDPGAVHTAAVWGALDPDTDALYIYREYFAGDKTTGEHAQALASYEPANWTGGAKSEEQWRRDLSASGLSVQVPPFSDVEAGIDRVIARIKTRRLIVFKTCRVLLDELGTYSRVVDATGATTQEIKNKEKFHALDALRYLCSGIGRAPASSPSIDVSRNLRVERSTIWQRQRARR
jgi:hypothetical protein